MAAGEGVRWGNYLEVPKYLITIDEVPILHRTVGLLRHFSPESDIWVVGRDERYAVPGAKLFIPETQDAVGIGKFLSSAHLWDDYDYVVNVYGDCWLSRWCMRVVAQQDNPFSVVGRWHASWFTGKPWGELFTIGHDRKTRPRLLEAIQLLQAWGQAGEIYRDPGGWELVWTMFGETLEQINAQAYASRPCNYEGFIDVDDFSDDFDYPQDYDTWTERRRAWLAT